ncbi:hypothetical protein, partial [uncultured Nostoc sp.]|uniref:hypothetical protein n=1 Tax=uncultured Nostoc sp. TaxID=340711 RepID=UPI0035C99CF7
VVQQNVGAVRRGYEERGRAKGTTKTETVLKEMRAGKEIQRTFDPNAQGYIDFLRNRVWNDDVESRAKYLEYRDQGHSLIEHGPERTTKELEHRVENGMIGAGGNWKSVQNSMKFNTYNDYMATREAAVDRVMKALQKTKSHILYALNVMENSERNQGIIAVTTAVEGNNNDRECLPVVWDFVGKRVLLRRTYFVYTSHGTSIGEGFSGVEGKQKEVEKDGRGGERNRINVWKNAGVEEVKEVKNAFTAFNIGRDIDIKEIQDDREVNEWKVGQHYPARRYVDAIEGNDTESPVRARNENPW